MRLSHPAGGPGAPGVREQDSEPGLSAAAEPNTSAVAGGVKGRWTGQRAGALAAGGGGGQAPVGVRKPVSEPELPGRRTVSV